MPLHDLLILQDWYCGCAERFTGDLRNALGAEAYNALSAGQTLYLNDERGELTLTPDFITDFAKYDLQGILRNWRKRPLLILHGEKDETVAVDQARLTFALAGVPKKAGYH